jgi:pyridoxal 5'-phosphate synthase pdxT subunit
VNPTYGHRGHGMKVGVLALQGAVAPHVAAIERLGGVAFAVRTEAELREADALIVPGGESTTMSKLLDSQGLFDPIAERIAAGMPVLGTCAGMILLAAEVVDGRPDQRSFGAIDLRVRRNAYGRQVDSFETELPVAGLEHPLHAVFIRAPRVEAAGDDVEVLAVVDGSPVLCVAGNVMVAAFHPELTDDVRLHEMFLSLRGD